MCRGAWELDAATPGREVRLSLAADQDIRPGDIVSVHDARQGRAYNGRCVSIRHRSEIDDAGNRSALTELALWVPHASH
jgi:hypothetical protein